MRLSTLLPYMVLLASCVSAGPVGYNQRRHEGHDEPTTEEGKKQLITTVMTFTKTVTLEFDLETPETSTILSETTSSTVVPTPLPGDDDEDTPEVIVTEIVTVTTKKTTTVIAEPTTTTTTVPAPKETEQTTPPVVETSSTDVPELPPTTTLPLSFLNPGPGRPEKPTTPPAETTTPEPEPTSTPEPEPTSTPEPEPTSTPELEPTSTLEPAPTSTPQPEQTYSEVPSSTVAFIPPTEAPNYGPEFEQNVPLAIKRNQEYAGIKEGDECNPEDHLLACEGTMGKSILQCGATRTYQSVIPCLHDTRCFATPKKLMAGVMVTCDTPEAAGAKFDMSEKDLVTKITGNSNGNDNGKGKEEEKDGKDNTGSYGRKRRSGSGSKRSYREIHYRI